VLHHHEWYDGSGYPEGISGERIPLEARILAVADAFDAMIRDDGRSDGLPMEDALEEIRQGAGTQFDPAVTTAFAELAERGEVVAAYR
jgi:HD-GYP domain-containing protein (c-di-GMP phosphodiesterase class II)